MEGGNRMKLFRSTEGAVVQQDGITYALPDVDWDSIFRAREPASVLINGLASAERIRSMSDRVILAPLVSQEVWAAGVTYYRSRDARMEEAKAGGGEDFYARVYEAERPELFIKATPHRVVGTG